MSAPEISSGWDASLAVPDANTLERLAKLALIQERQTRALGEGLLGCVYGYAIEHLDPEVAQLPGLDNSRAMLYRAMSAVHGCDYGGGVQFSGYFNDHLVAVRVPLYQHRGFSALGTLRIEGLPPIHEDEEVGKIFEAVQRVGSVSSYRLLGATADLTGVIGYTPNRQIIEIV